MNPIFIKIPIPKIATEEKFDNINLMECVKSVAENKELHMKISKMENDLSELTEKLEGQRTIFSKIQTQLDSAESIEKYSYYHNRYHKNRENQYWDGMYYGPERFQYGDRTRSMIFQILRNDRKSKWI